MVAERLEEFEELVALMELELELELLVHSVEILETMKNWDGLSIQSYTCWSMGCNLIDFLL